MDIINKINEIKKIEDNSIKSEEGYKFLSYIGEISDEYQISELICFCDYLFYNDYLGNRFEFFAKKAFEYWQRYCKIRDKKLLYSNIDDLWLVMSVIQLLDSGYLEREAYELTKDIIENIDSTKTEFKLILIRRLFFKRFLLSKEEYNKYLKMACEILEKDNIENIEIKTSFDAMTDLCSEIIKNKEYQSKVGEIAVKLYNVFDKIKESDRGENKAFCAEITLATILDNLCEKEKCRKVIEYVKNNIDSVKIPILKRSNMVGILKMPQYLNDNEIEQYKIYVENNEVIINDDLTVAVKNKF